MINIIIIISTGILFIIGVIGLFLFAYISILDIINDLKEYVKKETIDNE